jgi:hypothetical protein
MTEPILDCIVVSYNDIDFEAFAAEQKALEGQSGAYHEVKTNSLVINGKRVTYFDLLDAAVEAVGVGSGYV